MIGGVRASDTPAVLRTVLGSCIAVCLFDSTNGIGGMNHFMLPGAIPEADKSGSGYSSVTTAKAIAKTGALDMSTISYCTRYGVHAMELLINECMRHGADRRALVAKVFGGGHVLRIAEAFDSVPRRNVRFVQEFLANESIPIVSSDLGGCETRKIYFCTDTGRTFLKRSQVEGRQLAEKVGAVEREYWQRTLTPHSDDGNVTLF
jgi:chemotaxis protein CheD